MFSSKNKVLLVGKKGGFSVPAKMLNAPQKPKQEKLYEEYWK